MLLFSAAQSTFLGYKNNLTSWVSSGMTSQIYLTHLEHQVLSGHDGERKQWGTFLWLFVDTVSSQVEKSPPSVTASRSKQMTKVKQFSGSIWSRCGFASSEAWLPPLQAQTFSRLLPMSLGTSWACSTPANREPSCPHTTPSPTRWGWARMTSKASSTCMELTHKSCPRRHPRLHLHQTQRPMRSSLMWVVSWRSI